MSVSRVSVCMSLCMCRKRTLITLIILSSTQCNQCSLFGTLFVLNSRWSSTNWLTGWICRGVTVRLTGWVTGRRSIVMLILFSHLFEMQDTKRKWTFFAEKKKQKTNEKHKPANHNISLLEMFWYHFLLPDIDSDTQSCGVADTECPPNNSA